jgi:hypothetical protein
MAGNVDNENAASRNISSNILDISLASLSIAGVPDLQDFSARTRFLGLHITMEH